MVNLGASGTNSTQSVLKLEAALPAYRPRMAMVLTGNNDHWNLSESAYWQFVDPEHRPGTLAAKTRVALHSLRVFRLGRLAFNVLTGRPAPNRFLYFRPEELRPVESVGAVDPETHRAQLTYNLVKLMELTEVNNVRLVLRHGRRPYLAHPHVGHHRSPAGRRAKRLGQFHIKALF